MTFPLNVIPTLTQERLSRIQTNDRIVDFVEQTPIGPVLYYILSNQLRYQIHELRTHDEARQLIRSELDHEQSLPVDQRTNKFSVMARLKAEDVSAEPYRIQINSSRFRNLNG